MVFIKCMLAGGKKETIYPFISVNCPSAQIKGMSSFTDDPIHGTILIFSQF